MANIKDLKKKVKSTKGTLKITTAMKLVSAAKLAKAQHMIQSSRPYAKELEETIRTVSALVKDYEHDYLKTSSNKRSALLVISSNRGLCGGFNSQLAKEVKRYLAQTDLDMKVYFVGRKVKELIEKEVNIGKFFEFEKTDATFNDITNVSEELGELFSTGEVGSVHVAYNVFNSAISFTPTIKQLLPMTLDHQEKVDLQEKFPFDFKYDPSPKAILDNLIPQTYLTSLYTCLLDAVAAEHGSRMSSMDSATTNCKDMIKNLTLKMNKLRQAAITTELIEVISGAESQQG
jgi:F-type H+-transporting ATPase subunit gamma